MQEGLDAFKDCVVTSFCNTIVLRGMIDSKFLGCALQLQINCEFFSQVLSPSIRMKNSNWRIELVATKPQTVCRCQRPHPLCEEGANG